MYTPEAFDGIDMKDAQSVLAEARRVLEYDDYSGWFYAKGVYPRKRLIGYNNTSAFAILGKQKMSAGKMVWLWHHGRWPIGRVVRTNGISTDDRIENLREGREPLEVLDQGYLRRDKTSGLWWQAYGFDRTFLGEYGNRISARAAIEAYDAGLDLF